ncbi:hypothetical protein EV182_007057, partial [Spiromyces aspiralis]
TKQSHLELIRQCQAIERRVFPRSEAMEIAKELGKSNQFLFVALDPSEPCVGDGSSPSGAGGVVIGYLVVAISKFDCCARISKLCVAPSHRKRGVATGLFSIVLDGYLGFSGGSRAPDAPSIFSGIARCQLHVDPDRQDAVSLYRKFGFVQESVIVNYYALGRDAWVL